MNSSDQELRLWDSFRKGDKEAFAQLFRTHYDSLYQFGSKFTADTQLLEDNIQELFVQLWQAKTATPVISIRAYLLKSLKYKLLSAFRQETKIVRLSTFAEPGFEWSHEAVLIEKQEKDASKRRVQLAMESLSNRQREIIYLKYFQNLSYEEVSEIMNINYQAARNLLYQAIKSLRGLLQSPSGLFFVFFAVFCHYIFQSFTTI